MKSKFVDFSSYNSCSNNGQLKNIGIENILMYPNNTRDQDVKEYSASGDDITSSNNTYSGVSSYSSINTSNTEYVNCFDVIYVIPFQL